MNRNYDACHLCQRASANKPGVDWCGRCRARVCIKHYVIDTDDEYGPVICKKCERKKSSQTKK